MAKNNEKALKWLKISITIAILVVATAMAYATLNNQVSVNSQQINSNTGRIDNAEDAVIRIQKDLEYLKDGQDELKDLIKDNK